MKWVSPNSTVRRMKREGEAPAEPRLSKRPRLGGSLALPFHGASLQRMVLLFVATIFLFASAARAEHFKIELTVKSAQDEATAHSDTDPPPQGTQPRPVCHVKRGEDLTLQFFFSSNFPHDIQKDVTVSYYLAPEKEAGKRAPPEPGKPRLLEGSFRMDFKPETGRVGLRQRIHVDQPGAYLVRVESQHSDSDHEHFAALDLVVE